MSETTTELDYARMLENGYADMRGINDGDASRLEYLSDHVFDFTTYDSGMAALFARKALEVAEAISEGKTFDYFADDENYRWYLVMVNMPFFAGKLDWGTSIRGAWWGHDGIEAECPLWGHGTMKFTRDEWAHFISALIEFANRG
jgi:hypothetical protein